MVGRKRICGDEAETIPRRSLEWLSLNNRMGFSKFFTLQLPMSSKTPLSPGVSWLRASSDSGVPPASASEATRAATLMPLP